MENTPSPRQINNSRNVGAPKNRHSTPSFWGLTKHYAAYIKDYAAIVSLQDLLKKNKVEGKKGSKARVRFKGEPLWI